MRDKRTPLLAGLFVLVLIALAIGLTVFKPDRNSSDTPRVTVDTTGDSETSGRRSATAQASGESSVESGESAANPGNQHPDTPANKPALEVVIPATVSGQALDAWDDPEIGVTLTLLREDGDSATGPTTATDDEGRFTFQEDLTEGASYFVACLQDEKAVTATETFTVREGEVTDGLVIRIYHQAQVYGRVVDGETDEPLKDVEIKLEGRRDERVDRLAKLLERVSDVRSDEGGNFRAGGIAPGKYLVRAVKDGWTANPFSPIHRAIQEVELAESANMELMDFVLIQAGSIEGRVLVNSDKSPIPGASVELGTVLGGSFQTAVTDDEGKYRFDNVPPSFGRGGMPGAGLNRVSIRATAAGYAIATENVTVQAGQTRSGVDLMMDDGAVVTGTVLDNRMQPVAGARVYYNDNDFLRGGELVVGIKIPPRTVSATTDEAGKFTLNSLPVGQVTITASADSFANTDQTVTLSPGTTADIQIIMQPAGGVEGRVTNKHGEGVEGVPIAAYDANGPDQLGMVMKSFFGEELPDRGESTQFPPSIRTDEEGYYRVEGLKASEYVLLANTRDYEKYVSPNLTVKAGEFIVHDIQLATGATLFGRVYDQYGKPESGTAVTCNLRDMSDGMRIRTSYTDRNGNYEITGLSAGTYTVVRNDGAGNLMAMFLPNPSNQVEVPAGGRVEFDIYSQRPGTARLYGRVTIDGEPYTEQSLVLLGGGFGGFAANTTRTDERGNYEFRSVTLGTYQIARSRGPMPTLMRKRVRVDREGDLEVNIDFITVSISGRVELEGGEIPEGPVRVIASPVPPEGSDARNDDDINELEMMVFQDDRADPETGAFEITGLSPGFYRLTVRSENNGMMTRPYLNLRASVSGIVMTLPAEGATLKGTVVGLDDVESNSAFGLIGALTIEDEQGRPIALGGFDNGVNLSDSKEFTVENLAEGVFTVTLSMTGYTPSTHENVVLKPGDTTELTFTFETSGNARIKLTNSELDITAAMELEYEIVNSRGKLFKKRFTFLDFFDSEGNTTQDAEGNAFLIKDMPPETYTITLMLPGYDNAVETFTVVAGETVDVPVQFTIE